MLAGLQSEVDSLFPALRGLTPDDSTLREGEQTAGVAFTPEERVELVRRLDAAGFQQVQLYNTWHGDGIDEKAMELNAQLCALPRRQIMMEVLNFNTSDFARLKTMIDAQAQFKPDIIHASYSLAGGDEHFQRGGEDLDGLLQERQVKRKG
jgi:hypothetical protein